MESEEAIMENENNSNLESESNIRDRDQQHLANDGFGNIIAPYMTDPQDITSPEALWEERDLSLPAQSINTDSVEASSSCSTIPKELTFDKNSEQCGISFEIGESSEITFSSASTSSARDKCIPDYDFIGSDQISPNKINTPSRVSGNAAHELAMDEAKKYTDLSNSMAEEEMEVDSCKLDPAEDLAVGCLEHTNGDKQTDADDMLGQPEHLAHQERMLIDNHQISEESANLFEIAQSQPATSRSHNIVPSSDKNWDDDIDLLGEDSMDFISHKDSVAKEEMQTEVTSNPVLSGKESVFKDVYEESQEIADHNIVTKESIKSLPETEITKQSTSAIVISHTSLEAANLVSAHLKDSELLKDEEHNFEETSQSSASGLVPSANVCSGNDDKNGEDSEETMLHLKSASSVEEYVDVTFDKALRDTNVGNSFGSESLRDQDSHIIKGLRDSHVTKSLRESDSHVTESHSDVRSYDTEFLGVTDSNVIEDISNDNQSDEILLLQDDKVELDDVDPKPGIDSSGINTVAKSGQFSHETDSESIDSREANATSVDAVSNDVELRDVITDLSADRSMSRRIAASVDSLADEAAQDEYSTSKVGIEKFCTNVLDDVITESDHTTSYKHSKDSWVGETAQDEYSTSKEDSKETSTETVSNVTELNHTTSSEQPKQLDIVAENEDGASEEHVMGDTTMVVDDDDSNLLEHTTSEQPKQFNVIDEDKNNSGKDLMKDTTIMASDTGAQNNNSIADESENENTTLMNDSIIVPEHITSSEHKQCLDVAVQDKNYTSDEGIMEDFTKIKDESVNDPDHTPLSEQSKKVDPVTNSKIGISDIVMEDTKKMPLEVDSPSKNAKSRDATSSDQKDIPLKIISDKEDNATGKESVHVKPPKVQPKVGVLKVEISQSKDHSGIEKNSDVPIGKEKLIKTVSGPMEMTSENRINRKKVETIEHKEKSSVSRAGTDDLQRSLKPKMVAKNVNELTKGSMKTNSAFSDSAKQGPARSTRASRVKDETFDKDGDDDVKIISVKPEALGSKVAENGLDRVLVSDQQYHLQKNTDKSSVAASSKDIKKTESSKSKSSKSKVQTCLVCQKICKCKYNIVRNGDVKHLCDDACFKQFRKTPSVFLKSNDNVKPTRKSSKTAQSTTTGKDSLALYQKEMESRQNNNYKTCAVCQLLNLNTSEPFCNWKGLDFCGESCLGKFQANLNTSCSFCHAYIPLDMRATCCIKIGNDMRPFCKQRCYNEFKKKLRLCAFCQRDVAGVCDAFTAMVGTEGKFKEFCSQMCMKRLENEMNDLEILCVDKSCVKPETITCSICRKRGSLKYTVQFQGKGSKLCSDICLSAFKYTNKINLDTCDNCRNTCTAEEVQAHFVHYEGQLKHFCSDSCANLFRKTNSKVVQCGWCGTKKLNFDMIEKQDGEDVVQVFCSLNCLSLHRVNQQAKSGQIVSCDQCRKAEPAQYHLTMSDASVRNFCSYSCVMTFQAHFTTKYTSTGSGPPPVVPSPQLQPQQPEPLMQHQPQVPASRIVRGRMNTRQATARQMSPTIPVISSVVSLAVPQGGGDQPSQAHPNIQSQLQASPQVPPQQSGTTLTAAATAGNMLQSADGKHQILIQAANPKSGKNKSSQCRPVTQAKATSCKPHTQSRETQTDEMAPKCIMVPIPVPVYIPMPTVMYSAPAPQLIPFPIPIPVPVFIPTTRKSVNGISKAIQEIVERMPSDPLEAELLMMAEAVAADRRPGDSDTDSEADTGAEDFGVPVEDEVIRPVPREDESLMMRKREGQGEEDMIQMALRMAEEMSGPIEDLETSVEPAVVSSDTPANQQQHQSIQSYESHVDDDYIPPRSNQRGAKRPSRGRLPSSRMKRQRVDRSYNEDDSIPSEHSVQLQSMEPPPDVNYHLKFTYGVNAWRHWIVSKNAQIEKARQMSGSTRLRPFSTDILKCTTEELNYTLCMFIKEVRKPNGDEYSSDSIYYLCLGIQQYLYENNRIDNIFTDSYFEKFTDSLNEILKILQPKVNSQGQMLCRIEEEHLWESKQLGAHSPFILLNTLIYFHTKHFILKTAQEHLALSFAQILKHWKKGMPLKGQTASGKNVSLRFYCLANGKKDGLAARRNKDGLPVYEVTENFDNPLHCPVKLYEFFLSKCPESIKNRNDIFYPVPERSCVPDSPVWYSTQSIDTHTMDKMLTRVLLVREIQEAHLHAQPVYM